MYKTVNDYSHHVGVMGYALITEKGKDRDKKIGEVSSLTGLNKRTLQYYDDEGLLIVNRHHQTLRVFRD